MISGRKARRAAEHSLRRKGAGWTRKMRKGRTSRGREKPKEVQHEDVGQE